MTTTHNYDLLILSRDEVNFYNFLIALISVNIGFSFCNSFWFNKPKKTFLKKERFKNRVVHESRFLNWFFLHWFSDLAVVCGFWLIFGFRQGWNTYKLYPDQGYIIILAAIVLFLQTRITINKVLRKKGIREMFYVSIFLGVFAFGLSKINLIDYTALNESILKNNISYQYDLQRPIFETEERYLDYSYFVEDIYLVKEQSNDTSKTLLIVDEVIIDFEDLESWIKESLALRFELEAQRTVFQLHIDKRVQLIYVNQIMNSLKKSGVSRISFSVDSNMNYIREKYESSFFFSWRLRPFENVSKNEPELSIDKELIQLSVMEGGSYSVRNSQVKKEELTSMIKEVIRAESNYILKIEVNESVKFEDYFYLLGHSKNAIFELRDEYSIEVYLKSYSNLDNESKNQVRRKYPLRIID